ncbi:hypothetical protein SKAU_G00119950 [Synaphobranchus kaupii]|uniref:Uncharacterized protein n=1 Tax=Synaphobranchus kaupii TaxID=118154 RepID=A0A9Q1FNN3_SYNKA|nr:hypothetical protein SKAU_G00119950 [Synaphobranchus kaupii]
MIGCSLMQQICCAPGLQSPPADRQQPPLHRRQTPFHSHKTRAGVCKGDIFIRWKRSKEFPLLGVRTTLPGAASPPLSPRPVPLIRFSPKSRLCSVQFAVPRTAASAGQINTEALISMPCGLAGEFPLASHIIKEHKPMGLAVGE